MLNKGGFTLKKILPLFLVIILIIAGCGATQSATEQEELHTEVSAPIVNEKVDGNDATINNADDNEVRESEIGKLEIVKKNEEVGAVKESGPFVIQVNKMQVSRLEVSEDYKSMFDDKDIVTIVTLEVEVENKSTETNTIYPDQGVLVTNLKEQKDADLFLSGVVGGEYIGEVVKKDNVIFVLESNAEEISNIKYIISAPFDSDWNKLGDDITFELSF